MELWLNWRQTCRRLELSANRLFALLQDLKRVTHDRENGSDFLHADITLTHARTRPAKGKLYSVLYRPTIHIVTSVEVIIEHFWPEVRNVLPGIEDRGQLVTNWREKCSIMIETPVSLFCYTSTPLIRKICSILRSLRMMWTWLSADNVWRTV